MTLRFPERFALFYLGSFLRGSARQPRVTLLMAATSRIISSRPACHTSEMAPCGAQPPRGAAELRDRLVVFDRAHFGCIAMASLGVTDAACRARGLSRSCLKPPVAGAQAAYDRRSQARVESELRQVPLEESTDVKTDDRYSTEG
ncbi:hypothetical protein SKAU_G00391450 [Synaphobranchus kaupii]|uniref:Uncharacterized protein n=1 Tax=Synaphobranchus kaupii TaxID=118154 RepID=A0A9Q1IBM5_SYNKA|nr:hypothetical protein SKAU_G00391450 [Synaphobranchus kaupii]